MLQAAQILIQGKVQGVFFRSSAQDVAMELKLTGWIRNNSDGSVETFAQGEPEKLAAYIEWCKKGPPGAKVEHIQIDHVQPKRDLLQFNIE